MCVGGNLNDPKLSIWKNMEYERIIMKKTPARSIKINKNSGGGIKKMG